MSLILNHEGALQNFIKDNMADYLENSILGIDKKYNEQKEEIDNGLIAAFEDLCRNISKLQDKGTKGQIKYVYFSFLRTSIIQNEANYRIDAYNEKWFLDHVESFSLWNAGFIFDFLFSQIDELEVKRKGYREITPMDIDNIKLSEALKFHVLAMEYLKEMLPRLIESAEYQKISKDPQISILVGEFMDESDVIYKEKVMEG